MPVRQLDTEHAFPGIDLQYETGDLLAANLPAIAHGCNTHGVMGAGIAKAIREKFPDMYEAYRLGCVQKKAHPGGMHYWMDPESGQTIFNLFSQQHPGADARVGWLRTSLLMTVALAERENIPTIGVPRIGCGIGGLNWDVVNERGVRAMTTEHPHLIRYHSTSIVNGKPVGDVYVVDVGHVSPDCYSYTKQPGLATVFDPMKAAELLADHWWNAAVLIPLEKAEVLT